MVLFKHPLPFKVQSGCYLEYPLPFKGRVRVGMG